MSDFIDSANGKLTLLAIVLGAIAGYIELRLPSDADIQQKVDDKFVAAGSVPPHRMDRAEEKIDNLEATDEKLDGKIDRIVEILLEE